MALTPIAFNGTLYDVSGPDIGEIKIELGANRDVLWIEVNGVLRFRVLQIPRDCRIRILGPAGYIVGGSDV